MSRLAATPDQIRATVLAMLTEAGDAAPPTHALPPRGVGAQAARAPGRRRPRHAVAHAQRHRGVVRAGLAELALPEIPVEIAEQMRALWQAAVAVQLDEVVRLKREAQSAVETAQAARAEAELRIELLRQELTETRQALATRDTELAEARAAQAAAVARADEQAARRGELEAALATAQERATTGERTHAEAVATIQARYEGLSKQLLQETAHQRDAVQAERAQLAAQLKFVERRLAALEQERARLDADLSSERAARQTAAGEASALKAVTASQRAQLDELLRATLAAAPKPRVPKSTRKPTAKP